MVSAAADGAARHESGRELGLAARAQPPQLEKRDRKRPAAVHRQDRLRLGIDEQNVIVLAPVLVRASMRAPRLDEREPTIPTGEIPPVRHPSGMLVRPIGMRSITAASLVLVLLAGCEGSGDQMGSPRGVSPSDESSASPSEVSAEDPAFDQDPSDSGARESAPGRTFVVWTPGGLPSGARSQALKIPGVIDAMVVTGGLVWMSRASSGVLPRAGYEIPIEVAFVDPPGLAQMFPGAPGRNFKSEELIFSRTGFALRGISKGYYTLTSDQGRFSTRCCMSDRSAMGYEAIATGSPPPDWGASYLLLRTERKPRLHDIEAALGGAPWRVKSHDDTNYLRYADAVAPQMFLKERFGEFSARPNSDGTIDIDPRWLSRNIVRARVPLLGEVECHRSFVPQLRNAMKSVKRWQLIDELKTEEYAGCFNARFIGSDPSGRISTHAWGAALDVAAASNPLGAPPTLDRRVVMVFRKAGFNWGGDWLIPDGMHFEWGAAVR